MAESRHARVISGIRFHLLRRRFHKPVEQRVRPVGAALELRVELGPYEPGVLRQLHDLHQPPVGGESRQL